MGTELYLIVLLGISKNSVALRQVLCVCDSSGLFICQLPVPVLYLLLFVDKVKLFIFMTDAFHNLLGMSIFKGSLSPMRKVVLICSWNGQRVDKHLGAQMVGMPAVEPGISKGVRQLMSK